MGGGGDLPAPIPEWKRAIVVEDYERRKAEDRSVSVGDVARSHGVGKASLQRWLRLKRQTLGLSPRKPRKRVGKLAEPLRAEVVRMVLAEPSMRLYEVAERISEQAGFSVSSSTVRRCLRAAGIGKRRLVRESRPEPVAQPTRYNARHRRRPEDKPHRRAYPSDFTDAEWEFVGPLWEEEAPAVPCEHDLRDVLDAIRYIGATGSPWRFLPHDFPPHSTVYSWFERWARDGTQERVNAKLRRYLRRRAGREYTPSLLIIDSQTVKSHDAKEETGYDGGKKIYGRKRHIAVDTMGFPWLIHIHAANIQDRDGVDLVVPTDVSTRLERLELILADGGYAGKAERR